MSQSIYVLQPWLAVKIVTISILILFVDYQSSLWRYYKIGQNTFAELHKDQITSCAHFTTISTLRNHLLTSRMLDTFWHAIKLLSGSGYSSKHRLILSLRLVINKPEESERKFQEENSCWQYRRNTPTTVDYCLCMRTPNDNISITAIERTISSGVSKDFPYVTQPKDYRLGANSVPKDQLAAAWSIKHL